MFKRFLFLFILFTTSLFSQNLREIDTSDFDNRQELIKTYEKENLTFTKNLKRKYRGAIRNEIVQLYNEKHQEFIKNLKKNEFIFDKRYVKYCDSLVSVLENVYPEIKERNLKIFVSKSPYLNAMSIGEGLVILNLGMFRSLESEAQLLSILFHEIGHEKLDHVSNAILDRAKVTSSKTRKLQARLIRKQKYKSYEKSFKLMKKLVYSTSEKRRKNELEADSLGYEIFKKTTLNPKTYISSLYYMSEYDSLKSVEIDSSFYAQKFNLPNLAFNPEWLRMENFSEYDYSNFKEKIDKDSVKSHPEILQRIESLEIKFPELKSDSVIIGSSSKSYKELKRLARKEDVVVLHDLEDYGGSIYLILQKMIDDPDNPFLKKWLGENFKAVYEAKKKYQLNRHLERIIPKEQSLNYRRYLNFMWNLRLQDYKEMADYFSKDQ